VHGQANAMHCGNVSTVACRSSACMQERPTSQVIGACERRVRCCHRGRYGTQADGSAKLLGLGETLDHPAAIDIDISGRPDKLELERVLREPWCSRLTCRCGQSPRSDTPKYRCGCAPMNSGSAHIPRTPMLAPESAEQSRRVVTFQRDQIDGKGAQMSTARTPPAHWFSSAFRYAEWTSKRPREPRATSSFTRRSTETTSAHCSFGGMANGSGCTVAMNSPSAAVGEAR
jgi:hypothetical protein